MSEQERFLSGVRFFTAFSESITQSAGVRLKAWLIGAEFFRLTPPSVTAPELNKSIERKSFGDFLPAGVD
jgi:hypothetical protein